jgi:phosphatidylinositol alpha-mannosyltransferase
VRIALVHPYPWPEVRRGAERYLDDLSGYLARHGHDVTVVTGTHGRPGRQVAPSGAVVVRRPHLRRAAGLGLYEVETFGLSAFGTLATGNAEVVHAFVPSAALAARIAGRCTLYTVLGHPTPDQLPERAVPRQLFTQAVRRATAVATLSRASADSLELLTGRHAEVLSPGVRLECFPAELSPRTGPPRLLVSASLADPRKRAPLVLEAFRLLLRRRPDARLVFSGEGDATTLLREAGPEVATSVEAAGTGAPEEISARYRRATVTVLAAAHEAFGLALVESLASGTAVVCTPDGGMPEIVDATVGRVADAPTPDALCRAMDEAISLAAEPATAPRCVERARRWDWDTTIGPAHVRLYETLLARRPATVAVS